jgi:uncharacterized BrkB/YihY/UPF0761 family membrane protein
MSNARLVPETRLLGEGELSADHAWRALRRYGSWSLLRDAFLRFRSGDGFSHARALGLQLCLAAVPLLIALNGLASKLGDPHRGGRVVADTVLALTPGASESLVRQLLTDQGRTRDLGQVALALGLVTAVVALIGAAGQIERGANRIYGVDRDRPALHKYLRALLLTLVAGLPALVSFLLLVAGGAIGASMQRWYHWSGAALTTWNLVRWPVSVAKVSLLFRYAPRRQQPAAGERARPQSGRVGLDQPLITSFVEEGRQELSGRRQPGVEVPRQFLGRIVALVCGDLAEHKVDIFCSHSRATPCFDSDEAACHPERSRRGGKPHDGRFPRDPPVTYF